jgi:endonuclease YncB( thermonuclease family)
MKVSRAKPAYKNNRPSFKTRRRPGVYMIYVNGVLRYVGFSTYDVYKTMYRHFQSWQDSTQVRIIYPRHPEVKIRVIYTNTPKQAATLERALRIKYQPTDNPQQLIDVKPTRQEEKIYDKFETIYTYDGADPF